MQTLNISDSTPRSDSRLKTLFWPTIESEVDVDTVTRQGFWLCMVVALATSVFSAIGGQVVGGLLEGAFFFLAGVGVRKRSMAAAVGALVVYTFTTLILIKLGQFGVVRVFMTALLLANVRGIWLSSRLRLAAMGPPPLPMETTLMDRLSDGMPTAVWPWGRWVFYLLLPLMLVGSALVMFAPMVRL